MTALEELIKQARVATPEEERAQRISFVYGNLALSNPKITREMVEQAAEKIDRERESR